MSIPSGFTVEVDRFGRDEWGELLRLFADATLIHAWDFAETICPAQQASRLVLRHQGKVAALAQVRIKAIPGVGCGMAHVAWGPLWCRRGVPPDPAVLDAVLAALQHEYAADRGLLLRVAPNIVVSEWPRAMEILKRRGFGKVARVREYRTLMLDIAAPLQNIRRNLEKKWRQHLSSAEMRGLEVRHGTSPGYYREFLPVYRDMLRRKGLRADLDLERWGKLQEVLPEGEKPEVFLVGPEGGAVSGLIVSALGETSFPILAATAEAGRPLYASYLMHWRTIEWLRERGCRAYDLGGIDPEHNPAVYQFKKGFRARDVSFPGTFEDSRNLLSKGVMTVAEPMYDLVKCVTRTIRGRLFAATDSPPGGEG
ncbi:lipid II:glycine glycyltransferase FemX [Geobacter pickeringii]|uniref:BioF2-like acetyltransferase domain-containing protein n=1 Tax=Geobacter pickeringii TaxID=345632 RepID=A0A0B5BCJ6_9BACT|nr:peptidoglycan bridge formation glycyltransferase FemA/FemB family protein [Geobacter pickeringii]AJE02804.1 hypothetical protein GPICK_04980 [Geobacter pickeringii]